MILTPNNIAQSVYELVKDKKGNELKEILGKVVFFLSRKRMLKKSDAILDSLKKIIYKKEKKVEARIMSAKELSNNDKHEIKHVLSKRYKANEIILNNDVDKDVISGVRIEVNDEVIDLTIKNKLNKLQEYLTRAV